MIITEASHLDHNLTPAHIDCIKQEFKDCNAFFIRTVELPPHLPSLMGSLYGPAVGDEPISDDRVYFARRGNRTGESRMIARPARATRLLTVIAGPHNDNPCILYTAYGGYCAPREPWDLSLNTEERKESEAFWATHALAGVNENSEAIH